jgi:hypothetical protein
MLSRIKDHYKDVAFSISTFFENTKKEEETIVVPFHIGSKNLNFECNYMYQGTKLTGDSILPYFCAYPEHIQIYITTGAKPFTCKDCTNCLIIK